MSEWYDSQQMPKCNFRKLLKERINANRKKRDVLTDEEQQRLSEA